MAKVKVKRWAVRQEQSATQECYIIVVGRKPSKSRKGNWVFPRTPRPKWFWPHEFEYVFPDIYHLPPGGGPVEIRFADEA